MSEISTNYGPGVGRAHTMVREAGYKSGGDVAMPKAKAAAKRAVHRNENSAKHETPKLRAGGNVKGEASQARPDRRARGGATKGKTEINIIVGKGQDQGADMAKQQMAARAGLQKGIQIGAASGAQHPGAPMGGAPAAPVPPTMGAGPGPMGAPPPPGGPMLRAKGGSITEDAGAGSGVSRLERQGKGDVIKVRAHNRRRTGGGV